MSTMMTELSESAQNLKNLRVVPQKNNGNQLREHNQECPCILNA